MKELMAGLDASAFDYDPTSPIKSQTPIKVKVETREPFSTSTNSPGFPSNSVSNVIQSRLSQIKSPGIATVPLSPLRMDNESRQVSMKQEPDYIGRDVKPRYTTLGDDVKTDLLGDIEEIYDFDFDLADLSAFDDDLLIHQPPPKVCLTRVPWKFTAR